MMCPGNRAHHASSHGWSPAAVALLANGLLERPLLADGRCCGGELKITLSEDEKEDEKEDNCRDDIREGAIGELW
jgi:hypothetical protein